MGTGIPELKSMAAKCPKYHLFHSPCEKPAVARRKVSNMDSRNRFKVQILNSKYSKRQDMMEGDIEMLSSASNFISEEQFRIFIAIFVYSIRYSWTRS